jgi:hypothetical protein
VAVTGHGVVRGVEVGVIEVEVGVGVLVTGRGVSVGVGDSVKVGRGVEVINGVIVGVSVGGRGASTTKEALLCWRPSSIVAIMVYIPSCNQGSF